LSSLGQTDIARPLQREKTVRRRLASFNAERLFEGLRPLICPLHEGNRSFGETDAVAAARRPIEEGVKRHHLLDLHGMYRIAGASERLGNPSGGEASRALP